jgi:hypothetical protein
MGFCGSCQRATVPSRTAAPLLQIRHGYRARWKRLAFAVETDSDQWTLRVQDAVGSETLYTAHRSGARAAQVAAAEFAIFQELGFDSRVNPDRLAGELKWQEYW